MMNTYTFWIGVTIAVVTVFVYFLAKIAPDDTIADQSVREIETVEKEIPDGASTFVYSGGCFWCTEKDSEKLSGVYEAISGFTGGTTADPKYGFGRSGDHREASLVYFDPARLTYADLVKHAINTIDYTDGYGQFCDRGHEYTPAIYYKTEAERKIIESLAPAGHKIAIEMESKFYPVNDGHQDYYKKNSTRYNFYRTSCGRDAKVASLPKVGVEEVQKEKFVRPSNNGKYETSHLTPLQYRVTQHEGTERAFTHEYHKNKEQGIYVDIVGGQALYSSTDKYDSGSGWPSFHKSIGEDGAVLKETPEWFSTAIELKSTEAESHLGHIIFDNPHRKDYRRHCINGASIRFVPVDKMEEEGYGEWLHLFGKDK